MVTEYFVVLHLTQRIWGISSVSPWNNDFEQVSRWIALLYLACIPRAHNWFTNPTFPDLVPWSVRVRIIYVMRVYDQWIAGLLLWPTTGIEDHSHQSLPTTSTISKPSTCMADSSALAIIEGTSKEPRCRCTSRVGWWTGRSPRRTQDLCAILLWRIYIPCKCLFLHRGTVMPRTHKFHKTDLITPDISPKKFSKNTWYTYAIHLVFLCMCDSLDILGT